ncbi:hypothetical protein [Mesorhizobium sp.]|uniref:hypothetical protein n=1 Tax=Mesorhizobium sp. TaxID=1871066 RepID=UPI0025D42139|nr:hypothetical protein [Mesorhizobium sp.]
MQVLSRVLSFEVDHGKLATNPCEGIKQLYSNSRSDIIWTNEGQEADLVALCIITQSQ